MPPKLSLKINRSADIRRRVLADTVISYINIMNIARNRRENRYIIC